MSREGAAPVGRALRVLSGVAALAAVVQVLFLAEPAFAQHAKEAFTDTAVHIVVFGGLALLAWATLGGRAPLAVFALVLALGAADEAMQSITPGRQADVRDLLADAFGAAAMLVAATALSNPARSPGTTLTPHGG